MGGTGEKRHLQNSVVGARPPRGGSSRPLPDPHAKGKPPDTSLLARRATSLGARRGTEGLAVTPPELNCLVVFQRGRGDDVLRRVARRRDHNIWEQTRQRRPPWYRDLPPPAPRGPHRPSPRRRQAPCCCPSARQSPVGSKQGMPTGRRALAWLEAFLTQWPGRLSICEGPAVAFTARRPGLQPHSRAHPGLSRVVSLRHPEPALPRPPPQLGPRRSTEAAATTSQVHSPGGDSTSRELASGTGQLNAFIALHVLNPQTLPVPQVASNKHSASAQVVGELPKGDARC